MADSPAAYGCGLADYFERYPCGQFVIDLTQTLQDFSSLVVATVKSLYSELLENARSEKAES